MHLAARAGHLVLVKLLLQSGAFALNVTNNGRIPMWYAAAEGQTAVLSLLLKEKHDAYTLMEDRKASCIIGLIDFVDFQKLSNLCYYFIV